jgi:hypothetical protein
MSQNEQDTTRVQNLSGQWVRAIPEPARGILRKRCWCMRGFWTTAGYRGHYALAHVMQLRDR